MNKRNYSFFLIRILAYYLRSTSQNALPCEKTADKHWWINKLLAGSLNASHAICCIINRQWQRPWRNPAHFLTASLSVVVWGSRVSAQSKTGFSPRENSSGINNAAFKNYADISLPSLPGFVVRWSVALGKKPLRRAAFAWQVVLLSGCILNNAPV